MIGLFKKKQEVPILPIDKSLAREGFTSTIRIFSNAQIELESDFIYLYVVEYEMDKPLACLSTTYFAQSGNQTKNVPQGFSMFLTEQSLGSAYDSFLRSSVSQLFRKGNGRVAQPNGENDYKGTYYGRDFGYDAEAMSAVIVLLLEEVFYLRPEDVCLKIQLLSFEGITSGQESTATFDAGGNRITSSGFQQDLF